MSTRKIKPKKNIENMSQVVPKSQRPTLSLNAQLGANMKNKQRSNTPLQTEKSDSRSSTPAEKLLEAVDGQSPSPKGKRRVSSDSGKVRASPKPVVVVVDDVVEKEKNGHSNGTNGAHVEGNGVEKKKDEKNNKKDKDTEKEKANGKETPKATPEKKQKKLENAPVLGEKTEKGEMEKLVLEPDTPADSPMPKSTGKGSGRILKYTPGKGRISPFKTASERLQNASTIVNLSTVSEQSTESTSAAPSPAINYDSPVKPPTGRISGRRNTRPIKDIKMVHPVKSANDSTSSMTANLGSPVHNDSLRTPIISQLIGRKRAGTPEPVDDIHVDSPSKRARLDFSGFLGYVTTPVTLLKTRLSRIGLTSSTPRALDTDTENIADVSAMETEETNSDKKDVSQAVEATESVVEKEIEDIKAENAEKLTENTEIEETPQTQSGRRSVCSIM
uniref:CSON011164 protein n=1 Tax=Culicoides sonorensis TaxID=179676 RepID=A0A336M330_CULSO